MLEATKQRYPTFKGLSVAFSSSLQPIVLSDLSKAYSDKSPVICDLDRLYGYGSSALWVKTQLLGVDFVSSTKEGVDLDALGEFSGLFAGQYGNIKLTEFLLFVARFKLGRYGKFYGYFDMLTVGDAFKKFLKEKTDEIDTIIRDRKRKEFDDREPYIPQNHVPPDYIQQEINRYPINDERL